MWPVGDRRLASGLPGHHGDFGEKWGDSDMSAPARQPLVAILALREASASVVYGMHDLFRSAGRDWEQVTTGRPGPGYLQPLLVSTIEGPFEGANGLLMAPGARLADCPCPDIVCIPEVFVSPEEPITGRFDEEIAWLRRCHAQGAVLASACSGALLLAEAGLLDGLEATTHWAYCDALQARHPTVKLQPQRALVASGEGQRLVMAGGGTAWFDLGLYLIARVAGVDAAMQTARVNLIDWHSVGQQPFAQLSRARLSGDAVVADCQAWIAANYQEPSPVAGMVRRSGLNERTFTRRFRKATGLSPLDYVHTLRLEEAKQMLETSQAPIEAIAAEVGYQDVGFFSRLFRRKVGLSAASYRRRFGDMRRMLQGARR